MSADLAVLVNDPGSIERAADPGEFIIQACERAKTWLAQVLEHGDIDLIVECKSQAEAIRVYTMSRQLGQDARLSAEEIIRRAERGIGIAIRRGQETGEIRRQGQSRVTHQPVNNRLVASPTDFASADELNGNGAGIYHMTDDVSDDEFEDALAVAKEEANLTRANTVRKIRERKRPTAEWIPDRDDRTTAAIARRKELIGSLAAQDYSSRQIADAVGLEPDTVRAYARNLGITIPADATIGKTRQHDSNRIVRETVHALEGAAMGVALIDPDDIDRAEAQNWAASLTDSIRVLNRLNKTLKEIAQ